MGNLVNRTLSLVHKYRGGAVPPVAAAHPVFAEALGELCEGLPGGVDRALAAFDFRAATDVIGTIVAEANRFVERERPWELARRERAGDLGAGRHLDVVLATLVGACRGVARELTPFIPAAAGRLSNQLGSGSTVESPEPVFPRLEGFTPRST